MFTKLKVLKKYCKGNADAYIKDGYLYFNDRVFAIKIALPHKDWKFTKEDFFKILKNPEFYTEGVFAGNELKESNTHMHDLQNYFDSEKYENNINYMHAIDPKYLDAVKLFDNPIIRQFLKGLVVLNKEKEEEFILIMRKG